MAKFADNWQSTCFKNTGASYTPRENDHGFFSLDANWNFTYLNAPAEKMLQHQRSTLLGRNFWETIPEARGLYFREKSPPRDGGTHRDRV